MTTPAAEMAAIQGGIAALRARAAAGKIAGGCGQPLSDLSCVWAFDRDKGFTLYLSDVVPGLAGVMANHGPYIFTEDGQVTRP